jgi:hypothetical protein
MQSFPLATALAVTEETVGAQLASVSAAFALGAKTTEMAESVETAKTRGKKEETKRRNLRMKTARFTAISEVFLLWSRRQLTRFCPVIA